ncbi:probable proline--tRNA ligase, mitochondrial isoform X1 [Rhagoletis pomonella]|uniref:probable proline--tRNA ligase, mitochondrial isoform X1 n=2 Tax=Rhagoletis pomonella TaxID=28610 RepID=UPI001783BC56|nr:probable proline--tRNA ligase, mitochondrial isoform X1 [Rhagoletis pomonella]
MERISRLFWPVVVVPKNAVVKNVEGVSRSQKLLTELGFVKPAHNGTYQLMPMAQRVLDKCADLVRRRMRSVGGQQISMPVLTPSELWKKSGRLDGDITEFFLLEDRHKKQFILSPTHEEAVTGMLASIAPISHKQLPLRLFQIGPKFRDELKPRFGLIRSKEFIMKDLYTFDRNAATALETYNQLTVAYDALFQQLEVPFVKVKAATGMMGGSLSHEYHYLANSGEDQLIKCNTCDYAANVETTGETNDSKICPFCNSPEVQRVRGIEVGHTFVLNDKYSRPLKATFLQENGKPEYLVMGCYGIGISRLVAAAVEVLSTERELHWPTLLAPFDLCIIGAKQGSKEEKVAHEIEHQFCLSLNGVCSDEEVLIDDRNYLTIGKRLMEAKKMGYPMIVVISGKSDGTAPKLELHLKHATMEVELSEALSVISQYTRRKQKLYSIISESNQSLNISKASFG